MNKVHIVLQGKGGIGKSYIASLVAQYYMEKNLPCIAIDTDPVNATLAGYKAIAAERIELIDKARINPRKFDQLIERLITTDSNFVIDNGASSFAPLTWYLAENDAVNILVDAGKEVVIHSVIAGRQALTDTLAGFIAIVEAMPESVSFIVWLNEFFGDIEAGGKDFEQMQAYLRYRDRIAGVIRLPRQTSETFGIDMEHMLEQRLTFHEVHMSEDFPLMAKSRLHRVRAAAFDQMAEIM